MRNAVKFTLFMRSAVEIAQVLLGCVTLISQEASSRESHPCLSKKAGGEGLGPLEKVLNPKRENCNTRLCNGERKIMAGVGKE